MMISSWQDRCGVAEYARALKAELDAQVNVQMISVPMVENRRGVTALAEQINVGDIAHIQYASDYCGSWRTPSRVHNFHCFLKRIRIPCVVTVHDLTHCLAFRRGLGVNLKTVIYNMLAVPAINWTRYGAFLRGRFLQVADHVIVHTTASKLFLESLGFGASKVSVLYPGIPDMGPSNGDSIKEELGWRNRRVVTVFGFIAPYKGYELAIGAMKYLPHDISLLIAGGIRTELDGAYLEKLTAAIVSSGLQDRVAITGYLSGGRLASALREADIIMLPARLTNKIDASYSLSYALAANRPVITCDKPYFREIEQKYSAVRTFNNGSYQGLADAISEMLHQCGGEPPAAREFRETWKWQNVAEKTYRIYCDLACAPH